jgi:fermentation-respiration switch protein FrsA (DUF1100 family)
VLRRALYNVSAELSPNELRQLSDWIQKDVFRTIDRRRDYRKGLAGARTPTLLLLAGSRDLLAPPEAVSSAYEALGSPHKVLRVLGRAHGDRTDYGHIDLVLGRHAPEEVFAPIADWLAEGHIASRAEPIPQAAA